MTLVDKIRTLARQRDMSLPQLEQELGLGNGTISRWRNSSPNTEKLQKIADYFNVSMKNIRLRNIKRTDAYVHKETGFTTCQEIPDSRSF